MENLNQRLVFYKPLERALNRNQRITSENILKSAMQNNTDLILSAILDKSGKEYFKIGTINALQKMGNIDRSKSAVFLQAKKTRRIAISNFRFIVGIAVAEIILPLAGDKYLFLVTDFSKLWTRIKKHQIGLTGRTYLADDRGVIFNFYNDISPKIDIGFLKENFKQRTSGKLVNIPSKFGNFIGAYEKVTNFNLYALTLQLKKEAFWAITLTTSLILFLVFAISTAAYFAAWFFASKLSLPIANIIEGAQRVTNKDFSTPVAKSKSFIELEHLITSFNSMMKEIKKYSDMHIDKILEEKHKTDLLIQLINDGLILATTDGKILYSNNIAKGIIESKDLTRELGQKTKKPVAILAKKIINKQKLPDIFQLRIGTSYEPYYYRLKYSLYQTGENQSVIIMVFHDITLHRQVDKMKEEFFNSVAHDLRTPLVGMQGYIKLLKEPKIPKEKRKKFLDSMETSGQKITRLIEDILDVSKMQSGTLRLNKQNFELIPFIETVIISLKPQLTEKQLKLDIKIPKKPVTINADERLLERVFSNLLSNAIKHTPKAKKITIAYKSLKNFDEFTIKDKGKGIEPEKLDKIFDKFYQVSSSEKSAGYGLGLAITKKIVELHEGTIKVQSKSGLGTTITFTISKKIY
jgi:signal transduction histidine kinase